MTYLPPVLEQRWGHFPNIRTHGVREWTSSLCPQCGDSGRRDGDRWVMLDKSPAPRAFCRQCGHFEWAIDTRQEIKVPIVERERAYRETEKARLRIKAERERILNSAVQRVPELHEHACNGYRKLWHKEGINDWHIHTYKLGVDPNGYYGLSLAIPFWQHNNTLGNMRFRLLENTDDGKYRTLRHVPLIPFLTEPGVSLKDERVLVVEGSKKAMILYLLVGRKYKVVGLPGKEFCDSITEYLKDAREIVLGLDPDANVPQGRNPTTAVERAVQHLRSKTLADIRRADFPAKPDDLHVQYGYDEDDIMHIVDAAVPI